MAAQAQSERATKENMQLSERLRAEKLQLEEARTAAQKEAERAASERAQLEQGDGSSGIAAEWCADITDSRLDHARGLLSSRTNVRYRDQTGNFERAAAVACPGDTARRGACAPLLT